MEIDLPQPVSDFVLARGGRQLVMQPTSGAKRLFIVDLQEQKVVKVLEIEEAYPRIAAGLDKLMVLLPKKKELHRYSLDTFQKEAVYKFENADFFVTLAMGASSHGPLMVLELRKSRPGGDSLIHIPTFFDVQTMKPHDVDLANQKRDFMGNSARASNDGSTFTIFGNNNRSFALRLRDSKLLVQELSGDSMPLLGDDGKYLFTVHGVITDGGETIRTRATCPAIQGEFAFNMTNGKGLPIHKVLDSSPMILFDAINAPGKIWYDDRNGGKDFNLPSPMPRDRRVMVMPDFQLVATVNSEQNKVVLHQFDWLAELKMEKNHLHVLSHPPRFAVRGQRFEYQLKIQSSHDDAKLILEDGPIGMKLSNSGRIVWDVPLKLQRSMAKGLVSVRNSTGKEVFHRFQTQVVDAHPTWAKLPENLPEHKGVFEAVEPTPVAEQKHVEILPTKIHGDRATIELPGYVSEVIPAGGGRYLMLRIRDEKPSLAQLDLCEGKIVRDYPVPEGEAKIAASMEKLFIYLPASSLIHRYDLATGVREKSIVSPFPRPLASFAAGHGSHGPLLISDGNNAILVDVHSLRAYQKSRTSAVQNNFANGCVASANGKVFAGRLGPFGQNGLGTIVQTEQELTIHANKIEVFSIHPSADGNQIHTDKGIFTSDAKAVGNLSENLSEPSLQGSFCLRKSGDGKLYTLHFGADDRILAKLPPSIAQSAPGRFDTSTYFSSEAKVVAIVERKSKDDRLPMEFKNQVVLHRFDAEKAIADSGVDFLFVSSSPPKSAQTGKAFSYQVSARSRAGKIAYRLELAPTGMTVNESGNILWQVPADFSESQVRVVLIVKDGSNKESTHAFSLQILTEAGNFPVAKKEKLADEKWLGWGAVDLQKVDIRPCPISKTGESITLPGIVGDAVSGGAGRFLVLYFPSDKLVAVFDVNQANIIHKIPVDDNKVYVAAGLEKLVVVLVGKKLMVRYDLLTGKREQTTSVPAEALVRSAWMGAASRGPLMLRLETGPGQIDPTPIVGVDLSTLEPMRSLRTDGSFPNLRQFGNRDIMHYRAASCGRTFGAWCTSHTPSDAIWYRFEDNKLKQQNLPRGHVGHVLPGPEGNWAFTSAGPYNLHGHRPPTNLSASGFCVPAQHGSFYLRFEAKIGFNGLRSERHQSSSMSLCWPGESRPIFQTTDVSIPVGAEEFPKHDFTSDKRVHFVPLAKLVAVIPDSNDRIMLHRLDVDSLISKCDFDYLFVDSLPLPEATPGKSLSYPLSIRSKKGGVHVELTAGPAGMSVTADGKVTWQVPTDFEDVDVYAILSINDDANKAFHRLLHFFVPSNQKTTSPSLTGKKSEQAKGETIPRIRPNEFDDPNGDPKKETQSKEGKLDLDLPINPPSKPVTLKPAKLNSDKVEMSLPAPVNDVIVGGGGRYLLLPMPRVRYIGVFDVSEAKFVKYLPMVDNSARVVAGSDACFVLSPRKQIIERWNLTTFERVARQPLKIPDALYQRTRLFLGLNSNGPILVSCFSPELGPDQPVQQPASSEVFFVDSQTLKRHDLKLNSLVDPMKLQDTIGFYDFNFQRTSDDGRLFLVGLVQIDLNQKKILVQAPKEDEMLTYPKGERWYKSPSVWQDGKEIASSGDGFCWPAANGGDYFVASSERISENRGVRIFRIGQKNHVLDMPSVVLRERGDRPIEIEDQINIEMNRRWMLFADAEVLIGLSSQNNSLMIHRVELNKK